MSLSIFIKKNSLGKNSIKILFAFVFITFYSCQKAKNEAILLRTSPIQITRCGTITMRPYLDSFVYPTFYITTFVHYNEGDEVVHIHGNVDGDHDSSWYLKRYDKDSSFCSP